MAQCTGKLEIQRLSFLLFYTKTGLENGESNCTEVAVDEKKVHSWQILFRLNLGEEPPPTVPLRTDETSCLQGTVFTGLGLRTLVSPFTPLWSTLFRHKNVVEARGTTKRPLGPLV